MIHLEINQNTGITEQLSDGSVVGKLYQLAHGGLLDSTSNVVGNIAVPATYENYISYLTGQGGYFPNLYITATTIYISFADPEVVSVLTNYNILPANGGITAAQAASIGISGGAQGDPFYNNDSIETFDEFKYFRYA